LANKAVDGRFLSIQEYMQNIDHHMEMRAHDGGTHIYWVPAVDLGDRKDKCPDSTRLHTLKAELAKRNIRAKVMEPTSIARGGLDIDWGKSSWSCILV
jgi:hypothetical protein